MRIPRAFFIRFLNQRSELDVNSPRFRSEMLPIMEQTEPYSAANLRSHPQVSIERLPEAAAIEAGEEPQKDWVAAKELILSYHIKHIW